jgi:hypothetical protein
MYELSRLFDVIAPDTPLDAQLLITAELSEVTLLDFMEQTYGVPSQPSHTLTELDPQLALIFPAHLAETFNVVPFRSSDSGLIVLSAHPLSQGCVDKIQQRTRLNIQPRLTTSAHVALLLTKLYGTALPYFVSQHEELTAWLTEHLHTHAPLQAEPTTAEGTPQPERGSASQEFEDALDHNEILNSLLTEAQSSFSFAALFRVHNEHIFGWRTLDPKRASGLAEVHLSLNEAPLFQSIHRSGKHYIGPPEQTASYRKMRQLLQLDEATQILALPITHGEQVSAILYCEQTVGEISPEWVAPFIDLIRRAQWAMGQEPLTPHDDAAPKTRVENTPTLEPPIKPLHAAPTETQLEEETEAQLHLSTETVPPIQTNLPVDREPEIQLDLNLEPTIALQLNASDEKELEFELDLSIEPIIPLQPEPPMEKELEFEPELELELDLSVEPIIPLQPEAPMEKELELELDLPLEAILPLQQDATDEPELELEFDLHIEPLIPLPTAAPTEREPELELDLPMEPALTLDGEASASMEEEPAFNLSLEPILAEDLAHELQMELDSELEGATVVHHTGHLPEAPEPPRAPKAATPTSEELLARLHSENPATLSAAVDALLKRGATVDTLAQKQFPGKIAFNPLATNAPTPPLQRCSGLLQYIHARGPSALPIVRPHLDNRDPIARFFAVYFLKVTHVPEALEVLSRRLYDSEPAIRQLALDTLAQHSRHPTYEKILKGIVRRLRVPIPDVQVSSLQLLAQLRDKRSIPVLTSLLSSPRATVAQAAASSLTLLCAQEFGTDKTQWNQWWEQHHHEPRPAWLVASLRHPSHAIRDLSNHELCLLADLPIRYNPQGSTKRREKATLAWESWWNQQAPAPTSGSELHS